MLVLQKRDCFVLYKSYFYIKALLVQRWYLSCRDLLQLSGKWEILCSAGVSAYKIFLKILTTKEDAAPM